MSDLGNLPRDFEEWFAKEHGGMTAHSFAKIFSIREPKKLLSLWELKQKEVDSLKAQLNNMEACYIEKKKEVEACAALVGQWREKRMGGCSDYARGGLHSRQDCADDLEQALRGANA